MLTITMRMLAACAFIILLNLSGAAQQQKIYATNTTDTSGFKSILVQAQFPGGAAGWRRYLENSLNLALGARYIKIKKGENSASQTVLVSFLVNKEGKISETSVENSGEVHPKLAAESIRVISHGPDWIPATINGQPVIYRQKQSITFQVDRG